jgi:uncharacterized protein YjbI with pentapeptide repeats
MAQNVFKQNKYSNKNFSNQDFSNLNFEKKKFKNCNFSNANLSGTNLSECLLKDCIFTNSNFTKANLYDAHFVHSNLERTIFVEANLEECFFDPDNVSEFADFTDSILINSIINCNLSDANLTNADLTNAQLTDIIIKDTKFNDAKLLGTKFKNVGFTSCNLSKMQISEFTNFEDVTFSNCQIRSTNLSNATYNRVEFKECVLVYSTLVNTNMKDAKFIECDLGRVIFTNNDFTDANFTDANLFAADFSGSNLTNANFTDTYIRNTIFVGANTTNTNFTGAFRINPHESHEEIVKIINNLPKIFQLMNPNNETVPVLNTSLLINGKLDTLISKLTPNSNYDADFLNNLNKKVGSLKQVINKFGFDDFINVPLKEVYKKYSQDIQSETMQMNQIISYPLFFIGNLTPDTICYYLDDWVTGSLTAYESPEKDNVVSCVKGICERFLISVAGSLQIYFNENTNNDPILKTNYSEIISLILNRTYNNDETTLHYLEPTQFKTMVLDKCFQEWYGEHTFDEIAPENVDTELQKFKDCVKLKYAALPDKLNPTDLVDDYIETIVKITKGGKKKTLKEKKKKTLKKKTLKKKTLKKKTLKKGKK